MINDLIPGTPGLVAVHETEKGIGETPIVGFLRDNILDKLTAMVANGKGEVVPANSIRGFKRISWISTLKVGDVPEDSLFGRVFGKGFLEKFFQ